MDKKEAFRRQKLNHTTHLRISKKRKSMDSKHMFNVLFGVSMPQIGYGNVD